ncbi:SLC13 family permease [Chromatocurvus halotolerans]|uniref:Di/tricarboxylate transporter n=1 Tax=Chromatocurvus halotolerans TaxID=1132028 RepID=A0A4R2KXC2_9GAMM|nr:SLC13 family permease [Chromatocurvus halotolerans]TCO78573.1 di/tricarboxylate transporter [Chromatocurvus halotolerans]
MEITGSLITLATGAGWEGWLTATLSIGSLLILALTRLPPHSVMFFALTLLVVTGVLPTDMALAGFSNSGLITVAALFIVAAGMRDTGAIDLLIHRLLGRPATLRRALVRMCVPVSLCSAFMNNTPIVATMVPGIAAWARRLQVAPSKLMIPLSYASILGGTLTLLGTSTNLVVSGQYVSLTGADQLPLLFLLPVSLPVAILGLAVMIWLFPRWLPERGSTQAFGDMREFTMEVRVAPTGPLVGKSIAAAGLRNLGRVYLAEIERDGAIISAVPSEETLHSGDILVFAGDTHALADLLRTEGLQPTEGGDAAGRMLGRRGERRLVEAVVSPACAAIGATIRDFRFRDRYGAVVLAVARHGARVAGNLGGIRLQAGDCLLLEARPAFVTRQRFGRDFLLINDLETLSPNHDRAWVAMTILAAMVAAALVGIVPMLAAALSAALMMVVTGCCSLEQAEKSLDLEVLVTIACAFALGAALEETGLATLVAQVIVATGGEDPWILLAVAYAAVSLLTELITNNAAALLMLPIVLSLSTTAQLPVEPFIATVMMGASASFATPLGYQTNLMVMGPGGYRFVDFIRVGLPMNLFVGVCTVLCIGVVWL